MINETTHFITYYHEAEVALAEQFSTLLEEKYKEIQASFQFKEATQKYTFHLCNSVEEYIEKTGKTKEEYQDWMVGHSNIDTHTICLMSPSASAEAANQDMKKVAVHELVHMMLDDATGVAEDDTESWIAEGIAILYAEQTDLNYVSKTEYPKLAELIGFEKYLEVYCGEREWQTLIYDGFEEEAIVDFIKEKQERQ